MNKRNEGVSLLKAVQYSTTVCFVYCGLHITSLRVINFKKHSSASQVLGDYWHQNLPYVHARLMAPNCQSCLVFCAGNGPCHQTLPSSRLGVLAKTNLKNIL